MLVVFELDGCSVRDGEKWGELIIDACRLEPSVAMELVAVKEMQPGWTADREISTQQETERLFSARQFHGSDNDE